MDHGASAHRFGNTAHTPPEQARWKLLRQPNEVVHVDAEDPVWYCTQSGPQRQPCVIIFPPHLQPAFEHLGCRGATTYTQEPPRIREMFGSRVETVQPRNLQTVRSEIFRKSRLADDAGRVDDMTPANRMFGAVVCL